MRRLNPLLNGALVQPGRTGTKAFPSGLNPLLNGALVQPSASRVARGSGLNPLLNGALVQRSTVYQSVRSFRLNPLLNGALVQRRALDRLVLEMRSQSPSERGSGSTN